MAKQTWLLLQLRKKGLRGKDFEWHMDEWMNGLAGTNMGDWRDAGSCAGVTRPHHLHRRIISLSELNRQTPKAKWLVQSNILTHHSRLILAQAIHWNTVSVETCKVEWGPAGPLDFQLILFQVLWCAAGSHICFGLLLPISLHVSGSTAPVADLLINSIFTYYVWYLIYRVFLAVQTESVDSSIGGIVTDWLTHWPTFNILAMFFNTCVY